MKWGREMRHYIGIGAASLILFAWLATEADACSCAPSEEPSQEVTDKAVARASAVFLGYPVVIRLDPVTRRAQEMEERTIQTVRTQFRVLRSWKGVDAPLVWTGEHGLGCTYRFLIGVRYVVYAYGDSGRLITTACSRTAPEADSIFEMERLGPPTKTFSDSDRVKW